MIEPCEIPPDALLQRYRVDGTYTDCYATLSAGRISLAGYIEAFYTTRLFRLERFVLALAGMPSTDEQASQLAHGTRDSFAAWTVEARAEHELLLCDVHGRTRSWLKVSPAQGAVAETRLWFGSAVVPIPDRRTGVLRLGFGFDALIGFHKRYSVALLSAARKHCLAQSFGVA